MAPKPGLWPPTTPRTTESIAERTVYDVLRQQLPAGWYAWHSVRIQSPTTGDAEADFIIADPRRGALVLEVKGGRIEQREGLWYSNGKLLKVDPLVQAQRFRHMLLDETCSVRKGFLLRRLKSRPSFPNTPFSNAPSQGDLFGRTLGQQDLKWLDKALPGLMSGVLINRAKARW